MKPYDVGYKKPPAAHRFVKGRSGNPSGRPKKSNDVDVGEIIASAMNGMTSFTVRGQRKQASRDELFLRSLVKRALAGNASAADEIITILAEGQRPDSGTVQIEIQGWLPDFPGQSTRSSERS